jgi:TPR repeat protein
MKWYKKARNNGSKVAISQIGQIGQMYQMGLGVPIDYDKSIEMFKESAALGNKRGKFSMGVAYYNGDKYATYRIGLLYVNRFDVARDYKKANEWFLKAHEKRCSQATQQLGESYRLGRGAEKNLQLAEEYLKSVAKGEFHQAEFNLGLLYEFELNDKQRVIEMYSAADDLGSVKASEYCERLKGEGYKMPEKVKRKVLLY